MYMNCDILASKCFLQPIVGGASTEGDASVVLFLVLSLVSTDAFAFAVPLFPLFVSFCTATFLLELFAVVDDDVVWVGVVDVEALVGFPAEVADESSTCFDGGLAVFDWFAVESSTRSLSGIGALVMA